ncbi:hypothetical protein Taro_036131 [Colocasia esculenta]|uniref:Uncharacterized protein n=1 Tax=Colocasia esculenta TaxID=4460 RepID=A0A843WKR2_COLES|nr:hypothetical protein [Colocasia esculenta]
MGYLTHIDSTHELKRGLGIDYLTLDVQSRAEKRYGKTSGTWFSKSVKGSEPQIWGTESLGYDEQTPELRSSPDVGSPILPVQSRARNRYGRTSRAWFSKSAKGLSLKFGGQHPSDMKNKPMNSDRAQMPAVRYFLFKAVREIDTAGLPRLGSRNPRRG